MYFEVSGSLPLSLVSWGNLLKGKHCNHRGDSLVIIMEEYVIFDNFYLVEFWSKIWLPRYTIWVVELNWSLCSGLYSGILRWKGYAMQGGWAHDVLVGHCGWVGEVDSDGGVYTIYESELAHGHVSSPSHVEAPPYLECLYSEMQCYCIASRAREIEAWWLEWGDNIHDSLKT